MRLIVIHGFMSGTPLPFRTPSGYTRNDYTSEFWTSKFTRGKKTFSEYVRYCKHVIRTELASEGEEYFEIVAHSSGCVVCLQPTIQKLLGDPRIRGWWAISPAFTPFFPPLGDVSLLMSPILTLTPSRSSSRSYTRLSDGLFSLLIKPSDLTTTQFPKIAYLPPHLFNSSISEYNFAEALSSHTSLQETATFMIAFVNSHRFLNKETTAKLNGVLVGELDRIIDTREVLSLMTQRCLSVPCFSFSDDGHETVCRKIYEFLIAPPQTHKKMKLRYTPKLIHQ